MAMNSNNMNYQGKLKRELQNEENPSKFERLVSFLLGQLLDVPVTVAGKGFQYGADAGPAGQQGRRFRLECKKYRDSTRFNERELRGEIDQALNRDEALEAWVLVTTGSVPEQIRQSLHQKGEENGVPILILDWPDGDELPQLAALCAYAPDIVKSEFSEEAGDAALALKPGSGNTIKKLKRELQSWCLGFEELREVSHQKLKKIWNSPQEAKAEFGQDVAGGAQDKKIKRNPVDNALTSWWQDSRKETLAAVVGYDGVGKTWATLHWLVDHIDNQPIILTIPSSAVPTGNISETRAKRFLADRLYGITQVQDLEHWLRRLDRLLKRPADEGTVLTLFFDGLNQEPSFKWLRLLRVLQGETFSGRVRVIVSTRNHYFKERLSEFRDPSLQITRIDVEPFDTAHGGEFDQMLEFEGLSQANLRPDVVELARNPRLFRLVIRFREKLLEPGEITIHRLLWEYGRDSLGERAGESFSENEWKEWLRGIAQKHRDGIKEFSSRSLGETVERPDLDENAVYQRLSDIIDGRFTKLNESGSFEITPSVLYHCLGLVLLDELNRAGSPTLERLKSKLKWLEPISGFDKLAEILRAAVSILIEQGHSEKPLVSGVLVTAWLQTQNIPDEHRKELVGLAPNLPDALLDAVEHSNSRVQSSARNWAVRALRAIPRTNTGIFPLIVQRVYRWLCVVSLDPNASEESKRRRSEYFKKRVGTCAPGSINVLGVELKLVNQNPGFLKAAVPSIIEGFPLSGAQSIFKAAAIELTIHNDSEAWNGLKWLCLLNEVDPDDTAETLRKLSESVFREKTEPHIHRDIPARVAALLLWLTGQEKDDLTAAEINSESIHPFTYDEDYLPDPCKSMFPLERRHAEIVLNNTETNLLFRLRRTKDLWLDPSFQPPATFVNEVRTAITSIDVEKLSRHRFRTKEDLLFEDLVPALARCSPDLLEDLIKRKLRSMKICPAESRYWSALSFIEHFVLAGFSEAGAARKLRLGTNKKNDDKESNVASLLLLVEILNMDAQEQFDELIKADPKYIYSDLDKVLLTPTLEDIDKLISRYSNGTVKQHGDLVTLLSASQVGLRLSERSWLWIESFAMQEGNLRNFAFKILTRSDPKRFGRTLEGNCWSWCPGEDMWVNHYGTLALAEATYSLPFEELIPRLAPWLLLKVACLRGSDPGEVRLAAEVFGRILAANDVKEPDPDSILSIDRVNKDSWLNSFSLTLKPASTESESLRRMLDSKFQASKLNQALKTAESRISEARDSGASLYLKDIEYRDFEPFLLHASDIVQEWLGDLSNPTAEFRRRILLAEGIFLALCEVLLIHNPRCGVKLWRILRKTLKTRYFGASGVEDFLHMVFRVPDSSEVVTLRRELIELENCHTDLDLFDIVIAALYNGKADWVETLIREDKASSLVWRQRRAITLAGFTGNNQLPIAGAWPEGKRKTVHADLRQKSARQRWIEACARHWWQTLLDAPDPNHAYAAWVLFLHSADRRVESCICQDKNTAKNSNDFIDLKMIHVELNRSDIRRAFNKNEKELEKNFLGRRIGNNVGPWFR